MNFGRKCAVFAILTVALLARGQTAGPFTVNSTSTANCPTITVGEAAATVGINVSGTFSLTLQPQIAIAGQAPANTAVYPYGSTTSQNTITATGAYNSPVAGATVFILCASGYVSGSATVYLTVSRGSSKTGGAGGGSGTVTSAGLTVNSTSPSGIFTVTGSPVTGSGTLNFNLAGNSGGVPYFSSASVLSSSAAFPVGDFVLGGGAGAAPTATFSIVPAANGGTGVANTATLTLGTANVNLGTLGTGFVCNTTTTGALANCTAAQVATLIQGLSGCNTATFVFTPQASDCVAQSGGFANPMTTLGDVIYGGAAGAASRLPGPTSPNGVPQFLTETPSGGLATAEAFNLAGVPVDATNPATLLVTDRANFINWTSGSAQAWPAVATTFAANLPFSFLNTSGSTVTFTPNAGASDLCNGSSTCTLLNKFFAFIYQDGTTAPGHWFEVPVPTFSAFGSTCTNGLTWSTTTGIGCAAAAPVTGTFTPGQSITTNGTSAIQSKGPTFDTTQLPGATWDARLNYCSTNAAALNSLPGTCDLSKETAATSSTTAANGVIAAASQVIVLPPVALAFGNTFFINITGANSGLRCFQKWACVLDASNNGSAGTVTQNGAGSFVTGVKIIGGRLNKQSGNEVVINATDKAWFWENWVVNAGQAAITIQNNGATSEAEASVRYNIIDQSGSAAILVNNGNNSSSTTLNDIGYNLTRDANVNFNQNTQGTIGAGCSSANCAASPPTQHGADHNSFHDNIILNQVLGSGDCNNPNFGTLSIASWSGSGTTSITFTYTTAQPAGGLPVVNQVITGASFAVGGLNTTATITASTTTTVTATYGSTVTGSTGTGTITYTPQTTDTGCSEGIQTTDPVWYSQIKNNYVSLSSKEGIVFSGVGSQVVGNYCDGDGLHSISGATSGCIAWEKSSPVQVSVGYVGDTVITNNIITNSTSTALRYAIQHLFTGTGSGPYTDQNTIIADNVIDGTNGSGGFTNGIILNTSNLTGGNITLKNFRIENNTVSGSVTTSFNPNSYTNITGVALCSGNGFNASADTVPVAGDVVTFSATTNCPQPETDSNVLATNLATAAANLTNTAFVTGNGTKGIQTPSATATLTSGGAPTFPGAGTFSAAGAASTPGLTVSGAPFTGGSTTTNFPQTYLNSGASAPTTFSANGTVFGMNAPSGFTGNFEHFGVNGAAPVFQVTYQGNEIITQTAGTTTALNITNSTAATSSTAQSSPFDIRSGQFWYSPDFNTGSPPIAAVSATDCWSHQVVETNGTNGASTYAITHNGASPNCAGSPATAEVLTPFGASFGLQTNALTTPVAPTVAAQGTTGATNWSYTIAACIGTVCTSTPTATQITNGNATLNTTTIWNKITWSAVTNADFYQVFRTQAGTPSSLGKICLIPAGATLECDDKALTGDAASVPAYNATGQVFVGTGPAVGGGTAGGMFGTNGTVPSTLSASASGWYANSTNSCFDIVNGTSDKGCGAAWNAVNTFAPTARASGATPYFSIAIPADTGQTAATESIGYQHITATRTWATTGTVALQRENFFAGPTYASASASQTFTDAFTIYATPPVAGSNAIFTRGHTLGIVDATSAASSITGGVVVATTLGTAATSVGIGGGNVNAGGTMTAANLALSGSAPAVTTPGTTPYVNMNTLVNGAQNRCTFALTTSTFTLALSPVSLCTYTLPNAAVTWYWQCSMTWSNPAGTTPTMAVGVKWAQAPSAASQLANIYTTNGGAGAGISTQGSTATTTNANIVATGTLTNSATLFQAYASGTFTGSATSGTFSPTVSLTGTSATGTAVGGCTIQ